MSAPPPPNDPKLAIERYRNVIGYLQYENTTYWTRSGFMLVANSALLGMLSRSVPDPSASAPWLSVVVWQVVCMIGLYLSVMWIRALQGALLWISRWHDILLQLEPEAYGAINVFRDAVFPGDSRARRHEVRRVAERVARLFRLAWCFALIYGAFIFYLKLG